ncbi:MAG: lipocalin-like domain-containing protein [Alphaproteobacteria bacterium]
MTKQIGTWTLVRVEAIDASGAPVSPPPYGGEGNYIGRVVLTADRLSSTITDARPVIPEGEAREYSCYTGLYTFDGETLVTKVDQCSDPARMGTEQVRDVSFEGDLMVLRPPLQPYGDRPAERRTLWWRKISDV